MCIRVRRVFMCMRGCVCILHAYGVHVYGVLCACTCACVHVCIVYTCLMCVCVCVCVRVCVFNLHIIRFWRRFMMVPNITYC